MLHYSASVKYDNTAPWGVMQPWDILTNTLQRTTDLETVSRTVIGAGNKLTGLRYLTSGVGELAAAVDTAEIAAGEVGGANSSRPNAAHLKQFEEILSELYKEILTNSATSNSITAVDDELQQAIVSSVDIGNVDIARLLSKCAEIQKQLQVLSWAQTKLEVDSIQGFNSEHPTSAIEKQVKMMIDTCLLQQSNPAISILINNVTNVCAVANWHVVDIIKEINRFYKSFKNVLGNELQTPKFNSNKKVATQDSISLASPALDSQPESKTAVQHCFRFAKGQCKDNACPRLHDVRKRKHKEDGSRNNPSSKRSSNSNRKAPCRDFANGRCTRGKECRFSHNSQTNNRQQSNAPCWQFGKGDCRFGSNCRFSHDQANQQVQRAFVPKYAPAEAAVNAITQASIQVMLSNALARINSTQQPHMAEGVAPSNIATDNVQQIAYNGAGQQQQQSLPSSTVTE